MIAATRFDDLIALLQRSRAELAPEIERAAQLCIEAIDGGRKLLVCGNGGSAADAQHFAAELVGRFLRDRPAIAAIALTTDTSILTSVGNDFGYEHVFARQVEALASAGDVFFAISTSGGSKNVVAAIEVARRRGCVVIAMTGGKLGPVGEGADVRLAVPSNVVARVQEIHELSLHTISEIIDEHFAARVARAAGSK